MSWDILIQDLPKDVTSVGEIPEDFEPASLGSRADLISTICDYAPASSFSDPSWGELVTDEFVVEFNMGESEGVDSIMLHVRGGGEAARFVANLLDRLQLRAIDCSLGDFFSAPEAALSFEEWQAFRDRVPEWKPDKSIAAPAWLVEGARVVHSTFGDGSVGRVGDYKDVPSVWIDFDDGQTKALALEFGLPHLSPGKAAPRRRFLRRQR